MKLDWTSMATMAVFLTIGIVGAMKLPLTPVQRAIFIAVLGLIGVVAVAAIMYFKGRQSHPPAHAAAAAPPAGGDVEIDTLVREADRRVAHSNAGASIANLPLIFVIGDKSTAKTSTVVNSGIEPELLAGFIYQDNMIAPTRAANVWFARGTALVEAGGAVLSDPAKWTGLVKRLQPGKLKSLKGGAQSPRAVLLCVSLESFAKQGADAIAAAARYLQARLGEVAQTLGIRIPVYMLFTKTDRVPFFTEFVNTFSNEESSQVFGVTLPIRPAQQSGVYAEDETRRLTGYFDNLFFSLCDKRTVFPPRDNDIEKVYGAYEYPREMRKIRDVIVQFMVDVCRPSQLTTSAFLRGFYFSGVRPVVVTDAAPLIASRPQQSGPQGAGSTGATGMFRVGKQAEMQAQQAIAQSASSSRRVPQWMFLGHLFNNIILSDTAAMAASGSSVKVSALRRGLLIAATAICLLLSVFFLVSYLKNRSLETEAIVAAQAIPVKQAKPDEIPATSSLQELETLRQSLEKLDGYETDGAPWLMRWGLFQGDNMHPEVRRLYFAKLRSLIFGQTQAGWLKFMQGVKSPPAKDAEYAYPYNTLKGYLLTTSEYKRASDKSYQDFLGNLLLARWSAGREAEIGKDRMDLAKRQFDYYARVLSSGNPYSDKADADAVEGTRIYLAGFAAIKRIYYGMMADASKKKKSQSFNQWAEGSGVTLNSIHPVDFPFTKEGAAYMLDQIRQANHPGEPWVLGPYAGKPGGDPEMQKGLMELFVHDYINEWRTVLKTSHVVPYKNLKDAADKLDALTRSEAPILALLWWTSQNTAINEMPDVKDAFRVVQQVEPPTTVAYVPSAQPYNDALQALQVAVAKAADASTDPAALRPAQDAAAAARQVTNKLSSTFPVDRDGQLDRVVGALMLEPITEADKKLTPDLNSKGAGFCNSFGPITRKFPFNAGAREEATLAEVADIFKPKDGKLWVLYDGVKTAVQCTNGECSAITPSPVAVNPAFLRFFNMAVKFSRAVYGDAGADPNYHYSLIPHKSPDQIDSFEITVNGDHSKLAGGDKKDYIWPGPGTYAFKVDLDVKGGTQFGVQSRDGLWAAFRVFADADTTTTNGSSYDFTWKPVQGKEREPLRVGGNPLSYTFTIDTNGAPAVFSKDFLAAMKCVPQVTK